MLQRLLGVLTPVVGGSNNQVRNRYRPFGAYAPGRRTCIEWPNNRYCRAPVPPSRSQCPVPDDPAIPTIAIPRQDGPHIVGLP